MFVPMIELPKTEAPLPPLTAKLIKLANSAYYGFPRTIAQAEALQRNKIPIDTVVNFTVAEETLIRRLSGRRMHRITGEIFNIHTLPPPPGTKEADLIQRPDDKPEAIKKRIEVYKRETLPLIDFYEREGKLVNVDGEGSSEKVLQGVLKAIA